MKLILRVNDYNWPIPTDRFSPADELWRSQTALGEAHRR